MVGGSFRFHLTAGLRQACVRNNVAAVKKTSSPPEKQKRPGGMNPLGRPGLFAAKPYLRARFDLRRDQYMRIAVSPAKSCGLSFLRSRMNIPSSAPAPSKLREKLTLNQKPPRTR